MTFSVNVAGQNRLVQQLLRGSLLIYVRAHALVVALGVRRGGQGHADSKTHVDVGALLIEWPAHISLRLACLLTMHGARVDDKEDPGDVCALCLGSRTVITSSALDVMLQPRLTKADSCDARKPSLRREL